MMAFFMPTSPTCTRRKGEGEREQLCSAHFIGIQAHSSSAAVQLGKNFLLHLENRRSEAAEKTNSRQQELSIHQKTDTCYYAFQQAVEMTLLRRSPMLTVLLSLASIAAVSQAFVSSGAPLVRALRNGAGATATRQRQQQQEKSGGRAAVGATMMATTRDVLRMPSSEPMVGGFGRSE